MVVGFIKLMAWFSPDFIASTLSLSYVAPKTRVTMDSSKDKDIFANFKDEDWEKFDFNNLGLYACNACTNNNINNFQN